MKVGVVTFGTRGDVQPFLALTLALRRAGHDAVLAGPMDFRGIAEQYEAPYAALSRDARQVAEMPGLKEYCESGRLGGFRAGLRQMMLDLDKLNYEVWELSRDWEAMIFKLGPPSAAASIAEKRGIPAIEVALAPLEASREFPPLFTGWKRSRRPILNRLLGEVILQGYRRSLTQWENRFRGEVLGMARRSVFGSYRKLLAHPTLYAFSPTLLAKPSDWRSDAHVVGFFFLDEPPGWEPPSELCRFLQAGPPPVYVGFGSMPAKDPEQKTRVVLEGVRLSGQRALLRPGWSDLGAGVRLPEHVFLAAELPDSWLFGRMAAVVHHAGAGTTAAALRVGVPTICVPHNFDQPFWAQRARELGVTGEPILARQLSAERVASAITATVNDRAMRVRAESVRAEILAEDGLGRAVELFNGYAER